MLLACPLLGAEDNDSGTVEFHIVFLCFLWLYYIG